MLNLDSSFRWNDSVKTQVKFEEQRQDWVWKKFVGYEEYSQARAQSIIKYISMGLKPFFFQYFIIRCLKATAIGRNSVQRSAGWSVPGDAVEDAAIFGDLEEGFIWDADYIVMGEMGFEGFV